MTAGAAAGRPPDVMALHPAVKAAVLLVAQLDAAATSGQAPQVADLVTPERRANAWDFASDADEAYWLTGVPTRAYLSTPQRAFGDAAVLYVLYPEGEHAQEGPMPAGQVFHRLMVTTVHRPALGGLPLLEGWRVHDLGRAFVLPADVPHDPPQSLPRATAPSQAARRPGDAAGRPVTALRQRALRPLA